MYEHDDLALPADIVEHPEAVYRSIWHSSILVSFAEPTSYNVLTIHEVAKATCRRPSAEWRAA